MKKIKPKRIALFVVLIVVVSLVFFGLFNANQISVFAQNITNKSKPLVKYNAQKMGQWLKILKERPALSGNDKKAKQKIIAPLSKVKNKSGYVKETKDYKIEYVSNADEFFVEITSPDIQRAKYWATMWFKLNGISDDGLCKLPVVFYPNWNIAQQIKNLNIEFNPLPDNCQ